MGCKGSESNTPLPSKTLSVFHFPIKKHVHLLPRWERFVNRGAEWKAKSNTVVCEKHFDTKLIYVSDKRTYLNWKSDPVPTIYVNELVFVSEALLQMTTQLTLMPTRVFEKNINRIRRIISNIHLAKIPKFTSFSIMSTL